MGESTIQGVPRWAAPPDDLPESARDLWPDISTWPSPRATAELATAAKTRPDDYQSVLNGLRWCLSSDMSSAWSLLAAWLSVAAIVLAAMSGPLGNGALWAALGVGALLTFTLIRVGNLVIEHVDRKRHAALWLAAAEATRPRRRWFLRT